MASWVSDLNCVVEIQILQWGPRLWAEPRFGTRRISAHLPEGRDCNCLSDIRQVKKGLLHSIAKSVNYSKYRKYTQLYDTYQGHENDITPRFYDIKFIEKQSYSAFIFPVSWSLHSVSLLSHCRGEEWWLTNLVWWTDCVRSGIFRQFTVSW